MSKILIVEDEYAIVELLRFNLQRAGFEVAEAYDGPTGLELALHGDAELVLLDVMLPGMDGFELLSRLRQESDVPVIMLTAREEERDKVLGLETGADDYVTKPFSVKELIARIHANMRGRGERTGPAGETRAFGPFVIEPALQRVTRGGQDLRLTQLEYELLCYFVNAAGRVLSREELLEKVWGYEYYGELRSVDVTVRRLREKLEEDPANPHYLMTRRGAGYYLQK